MAAGDAAYQIVSITHGGVAFDEPVGGSFEDIIQFLPVVFADNVYAQAAPIQSRQMEAEVVSYDQADAHTAGLGGSTVFTLKQADATTVTITATNMQRGTVSRDFNNAPYTKRVQLSNIGTPVLTVSG